MTITLNSIICCDILGLAKVFKVVVLAMQLSKAYQYALANEKVCIYQNYPILC
jgi:hypothetical protein